MMNNSLKAILCLTGNQCSPMTKLGGTVDERDACILNSLMTAESFAR